MDIDSIRKRYTPDVVPACRICGSPLTRITHTTAAVLWGCDPSGVGGGNCPLLGREWSDKHYEQSQFHQFNEGDPDVLSLCDEVEKLRALLAEALENPLDHQNGFWDCRYCNGYAWNSFSLVHDADCIVMRARQVLKSADSARKE
jgi:hypothetical protein